MKSIIALASAAIVALATLTAAPPVASARDHHGWNGHRGWSHGRHGWNGDHYRYRHHRHHGGVEFGIGLLSGAIIGGALAAPYGYGYDPYASYGYGGYYPSYRYYRPYPSYRYYRPYPTYGTYYRPRTHYRVSSGNAHVNWCYAHYRSYRAWDDTFQPYYGPRRACISPYR